MTRTEQQVKARTVNLTGDETLLVYMGLSALVDNNDSMTDKEYEAIAALRLKIRQAQHSEARA